MNIDRGSGPLGIARAGDAQATSTKNAAEKPAFSLPAHATDANDSAMHAHAASRSRPGADASGAPTGARQGTPAHRPDEERQATSTDVASAPKPESTKPQGGPNAAARRESRGDRSTSDPAAEDATVASDAATTGPSPAEANARRAAPEADGGASLPDRMLALLSGAPFAAPVVVDAVAGGTSTTLPTAPDAALAATAAPSTGSALPDRAGALPALASLPVTDSNVATPSTAAAPGSTANAATDAFTALSALVGRSRDANATATSDGASTPGAFVLPAAAGTDAAQAASKAAPVVVPAALPLLLDADFDDGLGARVSWMAEQRIDHAQIRVSPEALGPIDVRLQLDGHRVSAQFHAANADVRQALESGMDRLRDLLGRQGMELGQAQVGSGARQGADGRGTAASNTAARGAPGDELPADAPAMRVSLRPSRGLLDEYA